MPDRTGRLKVLLLSSLEPSTSLLREILAKYVFLATAWNITDLLHLLRTSRYDAFLCDWDFPEAGWRKICNLVKQYDPDLPAIVVSRTAEEQEWVEVLEYGCFDILGAPYRECSVLSLLEHAVASREALARRTVA